jgi:sarcosine oxidase, subunit gamma
MMLQHMIEPHSALAGRRPVDVAGRLSIGAAPDCARFSLRVGEDGREAAGRAFGLALPPRIGGLAQAGERWAACLGPDEWYLLAPEAETAAIEASFSALVVLHSLVDVGHREVGIEIGGEAAGLALSAVSPLDLAAMPAGSATRTVLDRTQVVLVKHASDHYRIEVWQSFAGHVWDLLAASAHEIALDL